MCYYRIFTFGLSLLFATSTFAQQDACTTTDKKINKALQEALALPGFEPQAQALAQLANKYPANVQAYYYLGLLFYQKGSSEFKTAAAQADGEKKLQKSLVFFQAAIQKCPDFNPDSYYYSAKLAYNLNQKEVSYKYLESLVHYDSL